MPKVIGQPNVRFNIEPRGDEANIYLVFRYQAGRIKRGTREKVSPKFWDAKKQRATMDKRDNQRHIKINKKLNSLAAVVIQIWYEFNLGSIGLEDFRNEIDYRMEYKPRPAPPAPPETANVPTLFEFIENEFLPEQEKNAYTTRKAFASVFNHLKKYATEKRGGLLHYEDLNFKFFADFQKWLHESPRNHSIDTAGKTIKRIKQIMRAAHKRRHHNVTDYQDIETKTAKTSKFALTFEELEQLYALDLTGNPRLEKVRDLFLVGAYTGLRFSDFTRIRPEYIEQIDGENILTITAAKTGQVVSMPLFPIPAAILRKYNYQTPKVSNQKMNDYLKELGQMAGMNEKMFVTNTAGGKRSEAVLSKWERLTTHVARRSFATNFYRDGVQVAVLMKITGHTTERQFMQYIAIDGKMNALHFADLRKENNHLQKVS